MTREAAAIGAGLAPARAARAIVPGERIHVVGAAGAGASAAALLARFAGGSPSGCDPGGPSQYTPALDAAGIPIAWRHDEAHVRSPEAPDRLAVTKALTAIDPDHPELRAARQAGIPIEPWQQVVADAATGRRLIAVAGTHGKSTTSGWLVHTLVAAGADPAAFVGALLPARLTGEVAATARWGGGPFVVEADEYAGNFDPYVPSIAVLTSIEWDHPDVFADAAAVSSAFERWLRAAARTDGETPVLVANVADPNVAALCHRLRADWPGRLVLTAVVEAALQRLDGYARGLAEEFAGSDGPATVLLARIAAAEPDGTAIELYSRALLGEPRAVRIATAGRHNVANALGVVGASAVLGLDTTAVLDGLAGFPGVGRRLERKGEAAGVAVYDDYGHHPTAIRETIAALRQREPGRRLWAVYEPLTYHRTAALLDDFATVLATADGVAIADIWAGRDPDTTVASAAGLADAVAARRPGLPIAAPGSVEATAAWLARETRPGDAVLVMGGGRSYRIAELLLEQLAGR
ncbi:MAG TPA: cyanophycin synthetase [Clostridia bacterium]|nr:cyanophycin synthetase [Clostridia bacterium]